VADIVVAMESINPATGVRIASYPEHESEAIDACSTSAVATYGTGGSAASLTWPADGGRGGRVARGMCPNSAS
jgi:hypothetical protein